MLNDPLRRKSTLHNVQNSTRDTDVYYVHIFAIARDSRSQCEFPHEDADHEDDDEVGGGGGEVDLRGRRGSAVGLAFREGKRTGLVATNWYRVGLAREEKLLQMQADIQTADINFTAAKCALGAPLSRRRTMFKN